MSKLDQVSTKSEPNKHLAKKATRYFHQLYGLLCSPRPKCSFANFLYLCHVALDTKMD